MSFSVAANNPVYKSVSGLLLNKAGTRIIAVPGGLTNVAFPNSVTSIGERAFSGCSGLTSVTIPDGVTSIGDYVFYNCGNLTKVTIPDSVISIDDSAFSGCGGIDCVTLPGNRLSSGALGTLSLKGWTLMSRDSDGEETYKSKTLGTGLYDSQYTSMSLTLVGPYVLSFGWKVSCGSHDELRWERSDWLSSRAAPGTSGSAWGGTSGTWQDGTINIPAGRYSITWSYSIGAYHVGDDFAYVRIKRPRVCGLAKIFPASYDRITSITLTGDSVPAYALEGCKALRKVEILSPVTSIGESAFANCSGLTSVIIPASVKKIDKEAFKGCTLLEQIVMPEWFDGNLPEDVFKGCPADLQKEYENYYGVTFDATGGSVENLARLVAEGGDVGTLPQAVRDGYTFNGWFTKMSGGDKVDATTKIWESTTYYAQWSGLTYAVTLDKQGGAGGTSNIEATCGRGMPSITVPTRAGYMFDGYWSGTNGGGMRYYNASGVSVRTWDKPSAATLYAKWLPIYVVTLDLQGGSGGMTSVTATYDSPMPSITVPRRTGYTFAGYWTEKNGEGTQYYTASGASVRNCDITAPSTLYAKWIEGEAFNSDMRYCVILLSPGPNASSYPVAYMAAPPMGGFNTDDYKTTKLVLKLIEPGVFKMGGSYDVTLTKPFYCGLFEVTQKQYELVMGSNPSSSTGDMRPVENVTWEMIRGDSSTYNWPNVTEVDPASFVGRLQARTGLNFDLPTEAQWEYACRAGTTSTYNNGGSTASDLKKLGRYSGNASDGKGGYSKGHTVVGSYEANGWGLYDMHGNVYEWCLDGYGNLAGGVTDPVGPASASKRVERGGGWNSSDTSRCSSTYRLGGYPSSAYNDCGFRLVQTGTESYHIVNFNVNGGSMAATNAIRLVAPDAPIGTLPTPMRSGYAFDGWWTEATGGTRITSSVRVTFDQTFYAHWTANSYRIVYDANGGSGTTGVTEATYGSDVSLAENGFARTGYRFVGWATKSGGAVAYAAGASDRNLTAEASGVVTLYAVWVPLYTMNFHRNDASVEKTETRDFGYGVETHLPSLKSLGWARRGLDFLGWATSRANADAGKVWKKDWAAVSSPVAAGQTLDVYAVWALKPGSYAIQFIRNDGAGTWRTVGFNYGEKTRIPSVANGLGWARRGYDFLGWALTTADANAGRVWKGDWAYVATPVKAGEVLTVYAVWVLKPGYYQIRFNKNDGTGRWRTLGFQCDTSTKLSTIAALGWERPGYTFVGWASSKANADAGKVWKTDGEWVKNVAVEGRTLSVYAVWDCNWPMEGGPSSVQLWEGGPYWATTNIGAENPEDYGYYFWWGDTVGYKRENDKWVATDGSSSSFSFSSSNIPTYKKSIATLKSEGWITADGVLAPEHDAAHVHWGGDWRMPTDAEISALINKCTTTWTTRNGVCGRLVTGKGAYADRRIFLPAAGYGNYSSLKGDSNGYYRSSTPDSGNPYDVWGLYFYSSYFGRYYFYRSNGLPVRPVRGFAE